MVERIYESANHTLGLVHMSAFYRDEKRDGMMVQHNFIIFLVKDYSLIVNERIKNKFKNKRSK